MNRTVYLDNNATTIVAPEAIEAMVPYLAGHYGNPSSIHKIGATAAAGSGLSAGSSTRATG